MYWYKVEIENGSQDGYTYVGASNETLDGLVSKASRGEYIHLTNLVYMDRGEVREWSDWDASIKPEVYINPQRICSMMQFKGDPRTTPRK